MSDLTAYLWAQARRAPVTTARFAAGEFFRRGRLRFNNSLDHDLPATSIQNLGQRFSPFLAASALESAAFSSRPLSVAESIFRRADDATQGRFEIFGHHFDVSLNGGLDWHRDWVTGYRWPLEPAARLRILRVPAGSDIKRPWELGRCHHFLTLGQAYALSRDPRYAAAFSSQVLDFLHANPYPRGIHWTMPMEAAIRSANLATAAAFFTNEASLPHSFWHTLLESLFLHGRFVYAHREWNPVARGNHYLACVAGLALLGALFHDHAEGRRWLDFARGALREEMEAQVAPDGVAREGSSGYHTLVTELLFTAALTVARFETSGEKDPCKAMTDCFGEEFLSRLEKMFEFLEALCAGRAAPPRWGDSDDARFLPFSGLAADPAQELLALGHTFFHRNDRPEKPNGGEEAFWRLGTGSKNHNARRTPNCAKDAGEAPGAFADSGFYFFNSQRLCGSIRCGPLGINGWANHAHCDQLSFELCCDGAPILVDPGTLAYSSDAAARNRSRSTRSHNTPMAGGAEQNRFWPRLLFRILDDTRSRALHWDVTKERTEFLGEHSGYARSPLPEGVPFPLVVRRRLVVDRIANSLFVFDSFAASPDGKSSTFDNSLVPVEWNFPLGFGIAPRLISDFKFLIPDRFTFDPVFSSLRLHSAWNLGPLTGLVLIPARADFSAAVASTHVAPRFGQAQSASLLRVSGGAPAPFTVAFAFLPTQSSL